MPFLHQCVAHLNKNRSRFDVARMISTTPAGQQQYTVPHMVTVTRSMSAHTASFACSEGSCSFSMSIVVNEKLFSLVIDAWFSSVYRMSEIFRCS